MKPKHQYDGIDIRIDRYLVQLYPAMSRAYLQQIVEAGYVLVNQKKCRKGTVIRSGDQVEVLDFIKPNERKIKPNESVNFNIVYQSDHYLVLEKPPYLPTHPNQFEDQNTLANGLVSKFPHIIDIGEDSLRPGIVHRLDANTSGLMLAALSDIGFLELRKLFDYREIKKTYTALVLGKIEKSGDIEFDVAHHEKNPRKMVALVSEDTPYRSRRRAAKTMYEPIEIFDQYTLLKVQTLTGRMHQVRVHLSSIGHSLVGDEIYQTSKEKNRDQVGLQRHFLHASRLIFKDPWTKKIQEFCSELPDDLNFVIEKLSTKREG